jgi:ferredoxin
MSGQMSDRSSTHRRRNNKQRTTISQPKENLMATITARGQEFEAKTFEAPDGQRLVLAIEEAGIPILHRCGGKARCTTCRVTFNEGEPASYHWREKEKLEREGKLGEFRLSCHILCEGEMDVNVLKNMYNTDVSDPGPEPAPEIPEEID